MNNVIHVDANMKRIDKNRQDVKPEVPPFSFPEAFDRIRGEKRWCSWKWVLSESGRWTKPPMRALNEAFSSSTNPDTWDTLEAVRLRAETEPGERGVGLMLRGLPLLGVIDLDNCVDAEGNLAEWADDVVRRCGSYTEASPSGTGVKIYGFVKSRDSLSCKVVRGGCEVELFLNTARYVCVTGKQVGDFGFLSDITEVFEQLATPQTEGKKSEGKKGNETFILMDPEGIRKALSYVDANNYHKWILMGYALKSYGDEGKALWDEFSKRSSKYSKKRNDEEWAGFAPHTVDTGRIIYEAEQNGFVNDFSWLKDDREKAASGYSVDRKPIMLDDVQPNLDQLWIVKNLIVKNGVGMIYGPSTAGKTFIGFDLAASYCDEQFEDWLGYKIKPGIKRTAGYCFLEGGSGAGNRAVAWKRQKQGGKSGLMLFPYPVPFDEKAAVDNLIENVKAAGGVTLLVVDTLARAMNGGDENTSEGMGRAIGQADRLARELDCFVLLVHHAGKDVTRGARGWSGLKAAVDLEISVRRLGETLYRVVKLEKVKDAQDGQEHAFKFHVVDLGTDSDGDMVTSAVAVECDMQEALDAEAAAQAAVQTDPDNEAIETARRKIIDMFCERNEAGERYPGVIMRVSGRSGRAIIPERYVGFLQLKKDEFFRGRGWGNRNQMAETQETVTNWIIDTLAKSSDGEFIEIRNPFDFGVGGIPPADKGE